MTSHSTHEAKPDSHEQPATHKEHKEDEAVAPSSKADRIRVMLKVASRFAILGVTPLLAIAALAVAVIAYKSNKSNIDQLSQIGTQIESVNTTLSATKAELEKLKFAAVKEKNAHNESVTKSEERIGKIIQNISPMQAKLKIRPTLEEQLQPASNAPAAPSPIAHDIPVAKPTPAHVEPVAAKPHVAETLAVKAESTKPAPTKVAPKHERKTDMASPTTPAKKTSPAPSSNSSEKTVTPQVKAMKEAIEQYNGKH